MRTLVALFLLLAFPSILNARDDGRYSGDALKAWFNSLASGKGLCCSVADGRTVSDPDWGTHEDHYWVVLEGIRYAVPNEAVVGVPNRFGAAVVWPVRASDGTLTIRCFMPGSGT